MLQQNKIYTHNGFKDVAFKVLFTDDQGNCIVDYIYKRNKERLDVILIEYINQDKEKEFYEL